MTAACSTVISNAYAASMREVADLAGHGHLGKVVIAQQLGLLLFQGQHLLYDGRIVLLP